MSAQIQRSHKVGTSCTKADSHHGTFDMKFQFTRAKEQVLKASREEKKKEKTTTIALDSSTPAPEGRDKDWKEAMPSKFLVMISNLESLTTKLPNKGKDRIRIYLDR